MLLNINIIFYMEILTFLDSNLENLNCPEINIKKTWLQDNHSLKKLCQNIRKIIIYKMNEWTFGKDYKVAGLSTLYLTISGVIIF